MKFEPFISNTKALIKLATPILITQLIQTLMGFVDTIMAGRVSAVDMAAVALAGSIWLPIILAIYGVIMALTSIVAQYNGNKAKQKIINATYQTSFIAFILSLFLVLSFYGVLPWLTEQASIEPELKHLMLDYLLYIAWGAPAFCLFSVFRCYCEGLSLSKPTMFISIIGLLVNIPTNYIFINGSAELGISAYGGAGCGIATAIVYWLMLICMIVYCKFARKLQTYSLFTKSYGVDVKEIKHVLAVGIPIAFSLLFEVSLFTIVALIIAPFGAEIVASHQIAINFTGLVFMIPLSIGMAVTIRVGYALGEKRYQEAKQIAHHAIFFGLFIAIFTATFTISLRYPIAQIYIENTKVINLAASLMFLAALFQFSDAIQVISAGALRGYKDTKAILIITFIAYWLVGLTIGVFLGVTDMFVDKMGPTGFWIGFIIGLTVAAILLTKRLLTVQQRYQLKYDDNLGKQTEILSK